MSSNCDPVTAWSHLIGLPCALTPRAGFSILPEVFRALLDHNQTTHICGEIEATDCVLP